MIIDVKVPSPGESISEVQIATWLFKDGEIVETDDEIVEIDSDKATLSINAEAGGKLKILAEEGETVAVGAVIASIDTDAAVEKSSKRSPVQKETQAPKNTAVPEPEKPASGTEKKAPRQEVSQTTETPDWIMSPLAKKLMEEGQVNPDNFADFFKKFRISRKDVQFYLDHKDKIPALNEPASTKTPSLPEGFPGGREVRREKSSALRKKLAQRLVAVKNETAMLTTFNEVDMKPIMDIRKKYKEKFMEKYGVSLGFMSFFTKAVTHALALFPAVNARYEEDEIVYHQYADVGIAVSAPKGLMVPVLRNAWQMAFHEIEAAIKDLAGRARNNKIKLDEMQGGTFTITNGGVFGSMLSTPIINPPQSAILGMHNIVERPVVVDGQVVVRPVMYVALSYDHRIIDGKESVSFLYKVKEMLEDPAKLLLSGQDPEKQLLGL